MAGVKTGEFIAKSMSNDMEDIRNIRNMAYVDGKWRWNETTGSNPGKPYISCYSAPDFTTAKTTDDSSTPIGASVSWVAGSNITRVFSGNIYCAFGGTYSSTNFFFYIRYSTDNGASWAWLTSYTGSTYATEMPQLIDVLSRGSIYMMISKRYSALQKDLIFRYSGGSYTQTWIYDLDQVYAGVSIRSRYYYVVKTYTGAQWKLYYFTSGTFTVVENLTFTEPTAYDVDFQQFWEQDGMQMLLDKYYLRFRYVDEADGTGLSDWTEIAAVSAPSTANVIIWNEDYSRISYIIWDDYIWAWLRGGALVKLAQYSGNAFVGHIDWFTDGTQAYQFTISSFAAQMCKLRSAIYTPVELEYKSMIAPVSNQYSFFYDENDNLIAEGWVRQYKLDQKQYTCRLQSGVKIDFQRKITTDYSAETAQAIIEEEIDLSDYLWYEDDDIGGPSPPTETFTYSVKNKTILDRMKWADARYGYVTRIAPNNEVTWGPFVSSGISISRSSGGITSLSSLEKRIESFTQLTLYGKNGIYVTVMGDPASSEIFDWYEEIEDPDELEDLATQLVTDKNVEVQSLDITIAHKGFIEPGTSVTLTLPEYSISAETWYVISSEYDALHDICKISVTDVYIAPKLDRNLQNLEQKTANNADDIEAIDTRVTTIESDYMQDLIDDLTPQLGGNLDVNSKSIVFPTTTISDVLDEDDMSSDSAIALATQQSIKAYVDGYFPNSSNKQYASLICHGGATHADYRVVAGGIRNIGATDFSVELRHALPYALPDGRDLHIDQFICELTAADSNDYLDRVLEYGNGTLDDGTNRTSAGTYTYTFSSPHDSSAGYHFAIRCYVVSTTADQFIMTQNYVRYWYE